MKMQINCLDELQIGDTGQPLAGSVTTEHGFMECYRI